jgi:hypothetical protein
MIIRLYHNEIRLPPRRFIGIGINSNGKDHRANEGHQSIEGHGGHRDNMNAYLPVVLVMRKEEKKNEHILV